jgi:hypothetical protein
MVYTNDTRPSQTVGKNDLRYTHSPTVFGNSRFRRETSSPMIEVPYPHVQIIRPIICELEVGSGDFVLYHDLRDQF